MNEKHKKYFSYYMTFVGIAGQLLFFAQAYKIFTSHSAHDVSGIGFAVGLISVISWLVYGVIIKSFPLIIANIFAVIGALFVMIGIMCYG